ncbi:hypothetical protein Nepgr_014463 [Nepenthes gracilis]|uniref:Agenet domain-containing protein n=1 Tax=Nepenthes gracilis TaxID=150966 RepID=A0AAD3SK36_NEPGR|nr:hypothetical protein Nepgr_014463 [Nepenthes gracilis]
MAFKRGDLVEISSKEEGFLGSYYLAVVISQLETELFIVQYGTLLSDDEFSPLREIIPASSMRPTPPEVEVSGFDLMDEVEARANDGWWIGKVTRKFRRAKRYNVYFENSGEEIAYHLSELRFAGELIEFVAEITTRCYARVHT